MSRHLIVLVAVLIFAAALATTSLASVSTVKTGHYAGTNSEQGSVAFKVADHGKRIKGFTTTDGYNKKCQFSGGVGGIPTFTVKVPSMKITKHSTFTATVKATLGGFSGTFKVKGKFASGRARGTVTKVGDTCGASAANPTTPDYLETFTATRT